MRLAQIVKEVRGHYAAPVVTLQTLKLKRIVAVAALLLGVVALSACNGGQAWVASVDGDKISGRNFTEGAELLAEFQYGPEYEPDDRGIVPTELASAYVSFLIQGELLNMLAVRNGVEPSAEETEFARQEFASDPSLAAFGDAPDWFQDQFVAQRANIVALLAKFGEELDPSEQAKEFYEQNRDEFTQICVNIISSPDRDAVEEAHSRIEAGEDFADVAQSVVEIEQDAEATGTDDDAEADVAAETDGDDVECVSPMIIGEAFGPDIAAEAANADDGTLLEVFEAQGFHNVIRVVSHEAAEFADVEAEILSQLPEPGSQQLSEQMEELTLTVGIEINPKYGTWSSESGFLPPEGAEHPEPVGDDLEAILGSL